MTVWQENYARFVERRDDTGVRIDRERHRGVERAVGLLAGRTRGRSWSRPSRPGQALYELTRSVRRQWALDGIGELQGLPPLHGVEAVPAAPDVERGAW